MTLLDADYIYQLAAPLTDAQVEKVKAIPGVRHRPWKSDILAPIDAAFILHGMLPAIGVKARAVAPRLPRTLFPTAEDAAEFLRVKLASSELKPGVLDSNYVFQREGAAQAVWTGSRYLYWSPGAGKTLAGYEWGISEPGGLVITTPASVRDSIWRQGVRFTDLDIHVIDPDRYMRKRAEKLDGYLSRMERLSLRPVVIVAHEGLTQWIDPIIEWRPASVIFDEPHELKSHKRKKFVASEDGQGVRARDLHNMSSSAEKLSRIAQRRLLTDATPMPDRTRDLWAQLDLLQPGSWGPTISCFALRYCDAKAGKWGGLDMRGQSNVDELKRRLAFSFHHVPYEVSHRDLPPKRRIVTRLPADRQDRPSGDAAKEIKAALRKGDDHLMTARTMEAASRKRSYILGVVESVLGAKGKCTVFAGLRSDCERWAKDIEKIALKVGAGFGWAHGEVATAERDRRRCAYMDHPGPAVLVGTIDSYGVGVDLQDTDHAIVGHIPWNHGKIWQLENRHSRQGQKRPCTIEYVAADGTIDIVIVGVVLDKQDDADKLFADGALAGVSRSLKGLDNPDHVMAEIQRVMAEMAAAAGDDDGP